MKGIDVSSYQIITSWADVKKAGYDFAIIRAGWGKTNIDSSFNKHIEGAIKAGLLVGVYWFIYAKNDADVAKNAEKCAEVIGKYKNDIRMKVWADYEYDSDKFCPGITKETRTRWVKLFCETMKAHGYEVGVYANKDYLKNYFDDLSAYPLWFAYYAKSKGTQACELWQSSSAGTVPGIKGNVDLDTYYEPKKAEPKEEPKEEPKQEEKAPEVLRVVKRGDTLSAIAKEYNTTADAIAKANNIKNKNVINVGQILKIPQTTSLPRYEVTAKVLNVRAGATTRATVVRTLKRGQIIEIEQKTGIWGKLRGKGEWVCLTYLKKK